MKEQQNNTKDRLILVLTGIIALLLTIKPAVCADEETCILTVLMAAAAVVLSVIVVICRWNIRKLFNNAAQIDLFFFVMIWGWSVYTLMNAY